MFCGILDCALNRMLSTALDHKQYAAHNIECLAFSATPETFCLSFESRVLYKKAPKLCLCPFGTMPAERKTLGQGPV